MGFSLHTNCSNTTSTLKSYSEKPTPRMREPVLVRSATSSMSRSKGIEAEAESELMDGKKTVKELRLEIEQSNSRATAPRNEYLKKVKTNRKTGSGDWGMSFENYQSFEVMKELDDVKEELSRIKLDMASLLQDKRRAEKEAEASKSKAMSFSSSVERIGNEIDEINEEQVLAELARIEALKEYAAIETQRKQENEKHSAEMTQRRERINLMNQELDAAKVLETQLDVALEEVNVLQSELKHVKEMDKPDQGKEKVKSFRSETPSEDEQDNPDSNSITEEIETAKSELASVTEESFRVLASIDILRTVQRNVSEEAGRVKRREEKIELAIQNLTAKLLRGRAKIEAATSAEETANSTLSNLSSILEQYKMETEAAKKEVLLIKEENQKINEQIDKTESEIEAAEEKLQTAIEELRLTKSSEAKALENLKALAENTIRNRASSSQHKSVITISKFEYEYLKDRAAVAEEIVDKKVAAAQAWIEALKASEREILMETEKLKQETRTQMLEGNKDDCGAGESEMDIWMQNYEKNTVHEKTQHATKFKVGRGKRRVSISNRNPSTSRPGTSSSVSFPGRRRSKVMPNLGYSVPK